MKSVKLWLIAAVIGAIVAVVLGGVPGIAAGVSVFVILGVVLRRMLGGAAQSDSEETATEATAEATTSLADTRPEDIAFKEDQAVMEAIQQQIVEPEAPAGASETPPALETAEVDETPQAQTIASAVAPASVEAEVYTDDLTLIEGLPEKFAMGLHEIGITTFDQIAAWTEDDIEEVTEKLGIGRKQRIANQQWVEQAQALLEKGA